MEEAQINVGNVTNHTDHEYDYTNTVEMVSAAEHFMWNDIYDMAVHVPSNETVYLEEVLFAIVGRKVQNLCVMHGR